MLVFSAICPHPPIIIPSIGKDNLEQVKGTIEAMKELEKELYAKVPEIIIVISPHGQILTDAFTINLSSNYLSNYEDFGDFQNKLEYKSSPDFVAKLKERIEKELPIVIQGNESIDHGTSVPLFYLTEHLRNVPIVPISYSFLDLKKHWQFGQLLKEEIAKSDKRIAVIASGDMSHSLIQGAPAGYALEGEEFDKKIVELLKQKKYQDIINIEPDLIEKAAECGLRSMAILFGMINEYDHQVEVLSYEGPFGVGYLVADFKLK